MTEEERAPARVQIVDVKIPMDSMVWLLVKLAIASIPAALIIIVIGAAIAGAIRAL